jgi:hypothetical protein
MHGIDHSSCNWDGDEKLYCSSLITFGNSIQKRKIVLARERSTYKVKFDSSEDFPRQIGQYQLTMKVR